MSTTHFNEKAKDWDKDVEKRNRAKLIANEIVAFIKPTKQMNALEFGCGTGLLSFALKDHFNQITLVDSSEGMINVLKEKIKNQQIKNFKPLLIDLIKNPSKIEKTDAIFTLMTLHHINNIEQISTIFHSLLNTNGYLCIADLDEEDGSFHPKEQNFDGHFGFNKNSLENILNQQGFEIVHYSIPYVIKKEDTGKKYPIFLMIAKKITD
ncbi:class I SAM-dependent methyltransferase [Lutibacter sp.]|uniref:class I SAM-dependent DNA methyltransferase n=1 Tax=Lutibacter sp. TaxID=1925666 RepID=UPI001A1AB447|nr:class I SAM-dependent methyltransferase [Lutibacter sp.]MBI9041479.1 class I SAM-dependent methyltransferase [Lutibacter sp.]